MDAVTTGADLERALQYGSHRSVTKHLPAVRKKNGKNGRREKCLVILKVSRARNPGSKSLAIGGRRDTQGANDL